MGKLMDKILGKQPSATIIGTQYETFTEYSPVFTSYHGGIYEQEITRAAIDRFALACSKLKPEVTGVAASRVRRALKTSPNDTQSWPSFLYRLATILECDATAFVVPQFDRMGLEIIGLYPLACEFAEIIDLRGEPWIRFNFATGEQACVELENVAILTKFQYKSDYFGAKNCLESTMQLIHAQSEAQANAIRNGAKIRFIGALSSQVRPEDIKKKRQQFVQDNLGADNESGLMLYDQTFQDVRQITPASYVMDNGEMDRIHNSVYNYFGINEKILRNEFDEDTWAAYYEGKVEPFAVQLGEQLTHMIYTKREQLTNRISFSSNRIQYASMASKRNMIRDMVDRGIMSINEAREILQMPLVDGGDIRVIRGEYINTDDVDEQAPSDADGDSDVNDSDQKENEDD